MEMTRQEALELLELQEGASTEEIQQKYLDLYNEYKFRITNAPTNNLKKTYNEKLEQLEQAFLQLCPDTSIDDLQGINLPTDSPIIQIPSHIPPRTTSSNPIEPEEVKSPKNYKLLLLAGLVFVVGVAIGVFSLMQLLKNKDDINRLEETNTESINKLQKLKPMFDDKGEITNGKMSVVNFYDSDIQILWISGIYLDDKTKTIKTFDSRGSSLDKGNGLWIKSKDPNEGISPRTLAFERPDGEIWDGEVLYYTMYIYIAKEDDTKIYSGFWREKSHKNKYISITPKSE